MFLIANIVDDMKEELHYAEHYYKEASKIKVNYPNLARKYIDLAREELNHAMILHNMSSDVIGTLSKETNEYMSEYYECAHNYYIEKYDKISYCISKF